MSEEKEKKLTREERNEIMEGQYGDMNPQQCKDEIHRLAKNQMDYVQSKKDAMASWNELIKDNKEKIKYLVERIDYLVHEAQVANQLEQARDR